MDNRPRIVFMGTPEFAVASLGALLINSLNVVAVVTTPDKPAGRGRSLKSSAVAEYAKENYLRVLKPLNLKDPDFIKIVKALEPDIIVVVAFRILPKEVWSIPSLGTFNLHASLLPQYRGAAPINHAIINGESITGVTTFLIDEQVDTGNILLRKEISIGHDENAGGLHDRLMREGAKLVVKTAELLYLNSIVPIDQFGLIASGELLLPAPKIFTRDCYINWDETSEKIYNKIRGLSPHPGARTILTSVEKKTEIKILASHPRKADHDLSTGSIISDQKSDMTIVTSDGYLKVLKIQPEGKRKMNIDEFLRGSNLAGFRVTSPPQA